MRNLTLEQISNAARAERLAITEAILKETIPEYMDATEHMMMCSIIEQHPEWVNPEYFGIQLVHHDVISDE